MSKPLRPGSFCRISCPNRINFQSSGRWVRSDASGRVQCHKTQQYIYILHYLTTLLAGKWKWQWMLWLAFLVASFLKKLHELGTYNGQKPDYATRKYTARYTHQRKLRRKMRPFDRQHRNWNLALHLHGCFFHWHCPKDPLQDQVWQDSTSRKGLHATPGKRRASCTCRWILKIQYLQTTKALYT